jgi:hypothetical protein
MLIYLIVDVNQKKKKKNISMGAVIKEIAVIYVECRYLWV